MDHLDLLLSSGNWRLQRLMRYVEKDLAQSVSFTRAAEICLLEKTYFSRFFRSQTGMGFSEWIMQARVQRAKDLLRQEHHSIAEVANAVGYKDITTFERHFRRCENLSPSEYRKRERLSLTQNHNSCRQETQ